MEAIIGKHPLGKSGLTVSSIGVGSVGLSGLHGPTDEKEAQEAIIYAIDSGVNFIDTAPFYNNRRAEELLGDIVSQFDRETICLATKVGRYMDPASGTQSFDYSAETTKESVLKSLQCMKLSYIDLVQIHDVEHAPSLQTLINETIPCLVDLKISGLIKSIGVTGYSTRHVRKLVEACMEHIDVVMSYCRHNVYDTTLARDLPFYKNNNIGVINASPLGIGLFTNGESIASWHPATDEIKEACKEAANYCDSQGVDIARLALRHSAETEDISMTLWSSRKLQHMRSNISCSILPLTKLEKSTMQYIKTEILSRVQDKHWEEQLDKENPFWPIE
ncbi:uncharacterized protein [Watersipora subatra]|uniref:uncharacterized protein n=1 Tax=Watersipora subatra TaxID=2589382 RepID=UPI00355BBA20